MCLEVVLVVVVPLGLGMVCGDLYGAGLMETFKSGTMELSTEFRGSKYGMI